MKIRYYADAEIRDAQPRDTSAAQLHDHDITVEIDRIDEQHDPIPDFPGEVRRLTPEEVYERDLKRNRSLNAVIEQTPSEAFKRYGTLDIAGNVAVIDEEEPSSGHQPFQDMRTGTDQEPKHRQQWTFSKTSLHRRVTVSVSNAGLLDGDENFCPNCGNDLS